MSKSTSTVRKNSNSSQNKKSVTIKISGLNEQVLKPVPQEGIKSLLRNKYISKRSSGVIAVYVRNFGTAKLLVKRGNIVYCEILDKQPSLLRKLRSERVITETVYRKLQEETFENLEKGLKQIGKLQTQQMQDIKRNLLISNLAEVSRWDSKSTSDVNIKVPFWCWVDGVDIPTRWSYEDEDMNRRILMAGVSEKVEQWNLLERYYPQITHEDAVPLRGDAWVGFKEAPYSHVFKTVVSLVDNSISVGEIVKISGFTPFEVFSILARAYRDEFVIFDLGYETYNENENIELYDMESDEPFDFNDASDISKSYSKLTHGIGTYSHNNNFGLSHLDLNESTKEELLAILKKTQMKLSEAENLMEQKVQDIISSVLEDKQQKRNLNGELNEQDLIELGLATAHESSEVDDLYDDVNVSEERDFFETPAPRTGTNERKVPTRQVFQQESPVRRREHNISLLNNTGSAQKSPTVAQLDSVDKSNTEHNEGKVLALLESLQAVAQKTLPALKLEKEELERALIHQANISAILISRLEHINKAIEGLERTENIH